MKSLNIAVDKPYTVQVGRGLLAGCGQAVAAVHAPCTAAILTDDTVDGLYAAPVQASLQEADFTVCKYVFPHGEASKTMDTAVDMVNFLAQQHLTRTDLVIALGGGVVGDLAGFAAAIYLRGIDFVQIPTTFLAAIDSSVGGKTAVDLAAGKNLAGAFHQPVLVLCDVDTLDTLPEAYFADGIAEAIKTGVLFDPDLFSKMESGAFRQDLEAVIARCVELKGQVVAQDEFDNGERQKLNFGHTFGHAIEKCSQMTITHGHAVSMGMVIVTRASEAMGITKTPFLGRLTAALTKNGLPVTCPYGAKELCAAAGSDKKRRGQKLSLVVPIAIGNCQLYTIELPALEGFAACGLDA